MVINKGLILEVFTLNHTVYSGLLVAGSVWRIWLWLQTKPKWMCFQVSCCAGEKGPGFPLVGSETDTRYLTDWAFPVSVCIRLGSLMGRDLPTKSRSRKTPHLPGILSGYAYVYLINKGQNTDTKAHTGTHTTEHLEVHFVTFLNNLSLYGHPVYFLMILRHHSFM